MDLFGIIFSSSILHHRLVCVGMTQNKLCKEGTCHPVQRVARF